MSGITNPVETFFKDGIWGWCVNQWKQLVCDAAGHLQIDVITSGLPAGGATAANQATMITALQLVDDLRAALNSVATDELDVVLDGQNLDVEVTQTAPADLTPGIEGWDGSAWHKLPMLWGYSARWAEIEGFTVTAAGTYTFTTAAVPAGYVYKLELATISNVTGARGEAIISIYYGMVMWACAYKLAPGIREPTVFTGAITLCQGDQVRITQAACQVGDGIRVAVWGYKMRVAE